jgi:hypothetical protein
MRLLTSIAIACCLIAACQSKDNRANQEAKVRIWGRDLPTPEAEKRAQEQLDPTRLDDPSTRHRIIEMPFEEVVARMGFVEYHGLAKIEVSGRNTISVVEDSVIRQGLHGSFQIVQRDGNGNELRQGIYDNGVYYLSNAGGKMRVEGMVRDRHLIFREEAWQPLRIFLGYYGPRLGLEKVGAAEMNGRTAIEYKLLLQDGPAIVPSPSGDTPKKPKSLKGRLWIDSTTAVPVKADFTGVLDVQAGDAGEPGRISVGLEFTMRMIEGEEIKPKSFVPTITRHPVDLDPLVFLDGGIRTSTIIGGGKRAAPKASEEDDE